MKLGLSAGYWSSGPPAGIDEQLAAAEDLGFDSVWTAEAYGSDALTPLAWWGAKTKRIKLGTSIVQLSARTPAATAMAAMTMDHLSGGRFILGIGASGPQVVEGWYGQPYPRPLERTREYVDILRRIFARDEPVAYSGHHYQLPYHGGMNLGKPLKSTIHPLRTDIPVFLAAEGPKNVALAAEIADGWLPLFMSPKSDKFYRDALAEGFERDTARHKPDEFEVAAIVPVIVNKDVDAAADMVRPMLALYAGGMGARNANFHFDVLARLGYEEVCLRVQDLYLAGKKREAMAAIPTQMVEDTALIGPIEKIRDDLAAWKTTCLTTMLVGGPPQLLEQIAKVVLLVAGKKLKLGYAAGYWTSGPPPNMVDSIVAAEDLGYDSFWTAEAYGSDCMTPLAWWGSHTKKIQLGTAIMQLSARTPAAAAMAAMTLDHLSDGRFILGIGASGPQVVEGWYGRPYPRPLERTREYVEILRKICARDEPVTYSGRHYQMPYAGGMNLGKPLKSTIHPLRTDIPIYLGAEGPKNVAMTAEIADGWLPAWYSPGMDKFYRDALNEGFSRPGARRTPEAFEVPVALSVIPNDDLEAAADMMRPTLALYIGGMGARSMNFHFEVFARMGYEEQCLRIQDLYLAGKRKEAMAAVPTKMVEEVSLIGPVGKIKDELSRWTDSLATSLLIGGPPQFLETVAKIVW